MKSLFIDGLLPETRAQVRHRISSIPPSDQHTVVQKAESLHDSVGLVRRPATTAAAIVDNNEKKLRRGPTTLSVETSSAENESIRGRKVSGNVLAVTSAHYVSRTRSTNSSFPVW